MMGDPQRLEGLSGYAMNLSGISLSDERLLGYVTSCIERTGVPPDKVIFEVTETAGIDSLSVAQSFVRELRKIGCRFSLGRLWGRTRLVCLSSQPASGQDQDRRECS